MPLSTVIHPATLALVALLALPATTPAQTAPAYVAREIVAANGATVWPNTIDGRGLIVGRADREVDGSTITRSFALTPRGRERGFAPFGSFYSDALGVGAGGTVVGEAWLDALQNFHPYVRRPDGTLLDLLEGARYTNGRASAVNRHGVVVGYTQVQMQASHAFAWQDGTMTDLGHLGGQEAWATAINDDGVIVGASWDVTRHQRAFRWQSGVMTDLGTLSPRTYAADAWAIAADGTVVGSNQGDADDNVTRPVVWRPGLPPQQLPRLPGGGAGGQAFAINASHDIVGTAISSAGEYHAVLWRDGQAFDLQALARGLPSGVTLRSAGAINDAGRILVHAVEDAKKGVTWHHFLLVPLTSAGAGR